MRVTRNDLRLAARSFARHRTFTAVAVLSLALAIALNTTMYSVIDALVNPAVDVRAVDRLFWLRLWGDTKHRVDDATRASMLRTMDQFFEGTASYQLRPQTSIVEHGRRFSEAGVVTVSPNAFSLFGMHPLAGRVFTDADFHAGAEPVLVSERVAGALFADGESPVRGTIDLDGVKHPVIGVIHAGAVFPGPGAGVWMMPRPDVRLDAIPMNVVRLREGVTVESATRALDILAGRLATLAREGPKDVRFELVPAVKFQFHYRRFHYALIAAVIAVLLIACANLANLQLARGIGRNRELALRAALGASRQAIISQLLLESAVLAAAGLVAGLLLTIWGMHFLKWRIPPSIADYVIAPQASWRVLAFATGASALCVMLVGLLPAIYVSRVDPNTLLKSGAGTGASKANRRKYGFMVVAEIGLSLALLSGAAIVVRTALRIRDVQVGYDLAPLVQSSVLSPGFSDTVIRSASLDDMLLTSARSLPDVADAATVYNRKVEHNAVTIVDPSGASIEINAPAATYKVVSSSYFRTFGMRVLAGRDFVDGVPGAPEVIVDQRTARSLWPNSSAVGALIKLGDFSSRVPWVRVVGVVATLDDPRQMSRAVPRPMVGTLGSIYFLPDGVDSIRLTNRRLLLGVVTRSRREPERMPIAMRRAMQQLFPDARYVFSSSMEASLGLLGERQRHEFVASMFAVFAALALGLAALGVYGIVAHSVAERKREIGVRIALGATGRNVVGNILREGNAVALAGVALGLYLTRDTVIWLQAFSTEGDEYDVVLFATMALVLFIVAVLAALLPALRATRIDPVESLRSE